MRAPIIEMTSLPAAFAALAIGRTSAVPTPPPTQHDGSELSIGVGWPSGPITSASSSPAHERVQQASALADALDDQCYAAAFEIRIDYGERDALGVFVSPDDDEVTGFAFLAILGASIMNRQMPSAIGAFSSIRFPSRFTSDLAEAARAA